MISFRNYLSGLIKTVVLATFVFQVSSAGAQDKGTVALSWTPGEIGKSIKDAFTDSYSQKTRLKIIEAGDNPRFTQMQANRNSPNLDVGTFIDILMPLVVKSGLVKKVTESEVPNLAEVDPALSRWNNFAVPFSYGTWGIIYNADKVKKPIKSWGDLLRDDLKGRVSSPNINFNSSLYTLDALARVKGGSLRKPDAGFEAMRQIRLSGPGLWDQESIAIGWLKTGEIVATSFYSGSALRLMQQKETAHLRFVVPAEGGYLVPNSFVLVANSPNGAGGIDFMNYALSKEAQSRWPQLGRTRPANKNVPVPPDVAETVPPADKLLQLDDEYFVENREAILRKWNDIVNR